ncbi:FHA domain-containing protein [Rhodovulum strictum]|uniref:FHA domain-containing protein n=2 Tax=Rhodovulum strictum TaxID=58314 RepID=A0A844BA31_9RHOB|nr:FHA domain-containing protein [Rhodovulum strictum]
MALARRVAEGTASAAPAHAAPGTTRTVLFPGEGSAPAADGVARRQPWPQTAPADPAPTRTLADAPEPFEDAPQQRIAMPPAQAQRQETPPAFEAPPPAAGRAGPGTGRARTRLLGFGQVEDPAVDPFARDAAPSPSAATMPGFPVGWLVVIDGPGRGAHFALFNGVSQIGRGADQTVALDFGDTSISRSGHALLAFDDEQGKFFLGSGGKVNIVRLNGQPLLSTEEMSDRDAIRIGETTLRFVAFCGPGFTWSTDRPDANGG